MSGGCWAVLDGGISPSLEEEVVAFVVRGSLPMAALLRIGAHFAQPNGHCSHLLVCDYLQELRRVADPFVLKAQTILKCVLAASEKSPCRGL